MKVNPAEMHFCHTPTLLRWGTTASVGAQELTAALRLSPSALTPASSWQLPPNPHPQQQEEENQRELNNWLQSLITLPSDIPLALSIAQAPYPTESHTQIRAHSHG